MPKNNKENHSIEPIMEKEEGEEISNKVSEKPCVICGKVTTEIAWSTEDGPLCGEADCLAKYSRLKAAGKIPSPIN